MEIGSKKTNQFSPTIIGLRVNSFTDAEKKLAHPQKARMVNSKKSSIPKPNKVVRSMTGPKVNSYAKQIPLKEKQDRTRYNIDGWQIENPSFNEFD